MLRFCKTNVILYVTLSQNMHIFVYMCRVLKVFKRKTQGSLRFIKYTNTDEIKTLFHPFLSPILDFIHNTF